MTRTHSVCMSQLETGSQQKASIFFAVAICLRVSGLYSAEVTLFETARVSPQTRNLPSCTNNGDSQQIQKAALHVHLEVGTQGLAADPGRCHLSHSYNRAVSLAWRRWSRRRTHPGPHQRTQTHIHTHTCKRMRRCTCTHTHTPTQ